MAISVKAFTGLAGLSARLLGCDNSYRVPLYAGCRALETNEYPVRSGQILFRQCMHTNRSLVGPFTQTLKYSLYHSTNRATPVSTSVSGL